MSNFWVNDKGKVNRVSANGQVEPVFDQADRRFPSVISWLQSLERLRILEAQNLTQRFLPLSVTDTEILELMECIVSLAIRSPSHRRSSSYVAEQFRPNDALLRKDRNNIIALNMRHSYQTAVSQIKARGKYAILYSPDREYIFGDGFYHNFSSPIQPQLNQFRMLVPLTPEISVLFASPKQYKSEPRLSTIVLQPEETDVLNSIIQIYSCDYLFYRSSMPKNDYVFRQKQHFCLKSGNSIEELIAALPDVVRA